MVMAILEMGTLGCREGHAGHLAPQWEWEPKREKPEVLSQGAGCS